MAKQVKKPTKSKKITPAVVVSKPKRQLEKPSYKTLKLHKRIKHPNKPLLGSFRLMKANIVHLMHHKKLFLGISIVYFILSLVLVSGLVGSTDYASIKDSFNGLFTGALSQVTSGVTLFGVLITGGGGGKVSEAGGVYQTVLIVVVSLCIIWALRQTYAKVKITTKQSFYKSMTPLVPFILVLLVIGIQFIPLIAGASLFNLVISQGIASTFVEKLLWGLLSLSLVVLTLYMITSSIFAMYITTLPDVTPMQALRSARELVRYRRWAIMRKVIFLPFCLFILAAVIMIPILLYLTIIAQWVFIFLTMIGLVVAHGYMYRLYRELL